MQALYQLICSPRVTSVFPTNPREQAIAAVLLKFAPKGIVGKEGKRAKRENWHKSSTCEGLFITFDIANSFVFHQSQVTEELNQSS
jgi:hypothetical protein